MGNQILPQKEKSMNIFDYYVVRGVKMEWIFDIGNVRGV